MKVYEKGTFFSTKGIRNGYLFRQNGLQKSKGWGLGGGGGNFVEYPPEPTSSRSIIKNHSFSYKLLIRPAYSHSHILIRCYQKVTAIKEFMLEM